MGRGRVTPPIKDNDWTSVRQAINRLSALILGSESTPTYEGLTLSGLTQGSVIFAGASGVLSQDNSNLFWDDTNNRLGIGVNTPVYKLDVVSGTDNIVANFESTDAEALITFHDDTTITNRTAIGAIGTRMGIFAGGSEKISILTGGNVGIGTVSPDSVLHIKASVPGIVGDDYAGQLIIQSPTNDVNTSVVITGYKSDVSGDPDVQLWYLGSSSSGDENIIFLNRRNANLVLGTNDTHRLTILGNGNVLLAGSLIFDTVATTDRQLDLSGIGVATNFYSVLKLGTKVQGVNNDTVQFPEGFHKRTNEVVSLSLIANADTVSLLTFGLDHGGATGKYRMFNIVANGRLEWGPGNGVLDTNLYRFTTNGLKTDDDFVALTLANGTISIISANITSSIGEINFDDENLRTTGFTRFNKIRAGDQVVPTDAFEVNGVSVLGDGGTSTFLTVETNGDTFWTGSGTGLPYACMYVDGTQAIEVALTSGVVAEVKDDGTTSLDDGWLGGDLNLITFPTGGDEHYLSVTKAGFYRIQWSLSFNTANPGANVEIHGGVAVDGTAIRDKAEAHRTIANNSDTGNMSGTAMIDCPNGTEQISVWLLNTTNDADVTVEHGNVSMVMVGGT
ncbi:hypothetical protein LCGC14_1629290 [marine sediment metagenome]|uniref:Uncharacterized protein n=1 Tax=marine sediment metagenome TaxID=412755 RepID=A0A0F9KIT6_9ZZZZ